MAGNEYTLRPPKEVQRKSATNPNIAARVGTELAQRLRAFCTSERVTMESAMQVAIAEFLEKRVGDLCSYCGRPKDSAACQSSHP